MKTDEKAKAGLNAHTELHECLACPYRSSKERNGLCIESLLQDSFALIQQLEADKVRLLEESHEIRKDMLGKIQQLEAQVPRWISVEERLPERHGQQCVGLYSIGEYKGYLTPYVFTWHAYGDNGYVNGPHFNDEGLDGLKVHYWMPLPPLPEPPKEDNNDDT